MVGSSKFSKKKRFNEHDVFSNFEQDFDQSFFHELKSTTCLQHNYKHALDELAGASIENVVDIKNNLVGKQICK